MDGELGPLSDQTRVLLGNYNGTPSHATTTLDGTRKQYPRGHGDVRAGDTFLRPEELVPASALSRADGQPGLTAEVFSGAEFTGAPMETRVDPQVAAGPRRGEGFSFGALKPTGITRWAGRITPPRSGNYLLGVQGFRNKLYVDGRLVVDTTGSFPFGPSTADLSLEKGRAYALALETSGRPASPSWSCS
jgi:beta-glucosidase